MQVADVWHHGTDGARMPSPATIWGSHARLVDSVKSRIGFILDVHPRKQMGRFRQLILNDVGVGLQWSSVQAVPTIYIYIYIYIYCTDIDNRKQIIDERRSRKSRTS